MTTYSYEDTLHQIIKALLLRSVHANADHWVTLDSFSRITVRISNAELRAAADALVMSVQVHDHVDVDERRVTINAERTAHRVEATYELLGPLDATNEDEL